MNTLVLVSRQREASPDRRDLLMVGLPLTGGLRPQREGLKDIREILISSMPPTRKTCYWFSTGRKSWLLVWFLIIVSFTHIKLCFLNLSQDLKVFQKTFWWVKTKLTINPFLNVSLQTTNIMWKHVKFILQTKLNQVIISILFSTALCIPPTRTIILNRVLLKFQLW